jgi:hypothetical protein
LIIIKKNPLQVKYKKIKKELREKTQNSLSGMTILIEDIKFNSNTKFTPSFIYI